MIKESIWKDNYRFGIEFVTKYSLRVYCVISLLLGKYLLKPLSGIKHLYSCDCEVGSQICDFKSLLQIEWFRCCSPGRAATSATWRFCIHSRLLFLSYVFVSLFIRYQLFLQVFWAKQLRWAVPNSWRRHLQEQFGCLWLLFWRELKTYHFHFHFFT